MKNKIIYTNSAPKAIGPYSQAVLAENGTLFFSGQLPINPNTGNFISEDISDQTLQVLKNIEEILFAAGKAKENICKTTVLLTDIKDFTKMNLVYEKFFGDWKPARSAFQVAALPLNAKIEIEVVVV